LHEAPNTDSVPCEDALKTQKAFQDQMLCGLFETAKFRCFLQRAVLRVRNPTRSKWPAHRKAWKHLTDRVYSSILPGAVTEHRVAVTTIENKIVHGEPIIFTGI
jgi:hypothetical protein